MPPENLDRLRNARILVVEDSIANQTLARDLLLHAGAHVSLAGNGHEAIAAIRDAAQPFDAVLMDLQMPLMDGLEAIGIIRNELSQTMPIVATSAHSNKLEQERCLAAGADDCLPKPFHINDLYAVLAKCIEASGDADPIPAPGADNDVSLPESLDGIDMADGLDRLGNNRGLYGQLLTDFARTNAGLIGELGEAARYDDWARIRFLVHAIRSTAGSIGAATLSKMAAKVEDAVINGDERLGGYLSEFTAEMTRVMDALRSAEFDQTEKSGPAGADATPFDRDRATELYGRLLELLDDQDLSAQRDFDELASMLGGRGQEVILSELSENMHMLNYANARQILVRAEKDLLR
jgi:two-component system sensor histidine kinase/response regulator